MSMNIYNGRRMRHTIDAAYFGLLKAKPAVKLAGRRELAKVTAQMVVSMIDRAAISGLTGSTSTKAAYDVSEAFAAALREIYDRQANSKKTGLRDPFVDKEVEVYLFPRSADTLMMVNTECPEMLAVVDQIDSVEDYSWWNSTDRPEGVSSAEWQERERAWKEALPGAGVPSERCLSFSLFDGSIYLNDVTDIVEEHLPSLEERMRRAMQNLHVARNYDRSKDKLSKVMSLCSEAVEDDRIRNRLTEELSGLIKPVTLRSKLPSNDKQDGGAQT